MPALVSILDFAYRIGFTNLYDWQSRILLRYEAGESVAAACANYTGKTSIVFVICGLWTLYCFPRSRLMYMSATHDQVVNQYFSVFSRFSDHRCFAGWQWLENEVRNSSGGFLFGRASEVGGNIEGIHDQVGSPAGLLIDEAKTIRDDVLNTSRAVIRRLGCSRVRRDRRAGVSIGSVRPRRIGGGCSGCPPASERTLVKRGSRLTERTSRTAYSGSSTAPNGCTTPGIR
jgi:hypothetical protein